MKHSFLTEILQEYEAIRNHNKKLSKDRQNEIEEQIPQLKEIYQEINMHLLDQTRQIIAMPHQLEDIMARTNEKILLLRNKEREYLQGMGYSPQYPELIYSCEKCRDTGYVGEPIREKCSCMVQRLLQKAYQSSTIQELEIQNFAFFDPLVFPDEIPIGSKITQRAYIEKIKERCMKYAESFPHTGKPNMLFTGNTGLGKTFLLNCIAKSVLDQAYTVLKLTSYRMFETLFDYHTDKRKERASEVDYLYHVDLLIIDDIGTEPMLNNITCEYLFNIINERLRDQMHTLISTNLTPKNLTLRYTERVASRLLDASHTSIIQFAGQDIRRNKSPGFPSLS